MKKVTTILTNTALDRTQPGLPMKPGRSGTMTHDYKRHGTSTLFAALNTQTGEVIGQCKKRHRHQEFLAFLKTVEKQTPKALDLHLIVDNYATHKHEKVKTWLKQNNRVHLHFIPTSSSWLNFNVINLSLTVFFDTASGIRGLGLFSCLSGTCVLGARPLPHRPYAAITAMRGPVAKFPRKA